MSKSDWIFVQKGVSILANPASQKVPPEPAFAAPSRSDVMNPSEQSDGPTSVPAHELKKLERSLSELAAQVGSITSALDTTTRNNEPQPALAGRLAEGDIKAAAQVKEIIKARRGRSNYFQGDLFADPAWDILLDLARAELEGQRVSVTGLCAAASVPPTTALRWITTLLDEGLLLTHMDPLDGRRKFVELTATASASLKQYFSRFASGTVALS